MEKQAVIKEGTSPSKISGKPSVIVKNGSALAAGETDTHKAQEEHLANQMRSDYNNKNEG